MPQSTEMPLEGLLLQVHGSITMAPATMEVIIPVLTITLAMVWVCMFHMHGGLGGMYGGGMYGKGMYGGGMYGNSMYGGGYGRLYGSGCMVVECIMLVLEVQWAAMEWAGGVHTEPKILIILMVV